MGNKLKQGNKVDLSPKRIEMETRILKSKFFICISMK